MAIWRSIGVDDDVLLLSEVARNQFSRILRSDLTGSVPAHSVANDKEVELLINDIIILVHLANFTNT